MNKDKIVSVRSRNGGGVFYMIPEHQILRNFTRNEVKKISLEELQWLQYVEGGEYILKNCLIVEDKTALDYLNIQVEPEYFYTEADIIKILEKGSLDELEDMLNFSPRGNIEIIKSAAVSLPLKDTDKMDLILEKTGFNVAGAIKLEKDLAADEEEVEIKEAPKRKATKPVRKTEEKEIVSH